MQQRRHPADQTSRYDAQTTAIIENSTRGLVPFITPESGFECPHAIILTQDAEQNREIIDKAVQMSESEYAKRSFGVREYVLIFHNWDRIYERIYQMIQAASELEALFVSKTGGIDNETGRICPNS